MITIIQVNAFQEPLFRFQFEHAGGGTYVFYGMNDKTRHNAELRNFK